MESTLDSVWKPSGLEILQIIQTFLLGLSNPGRQVTTSVDNKSPLNECPGVQAQHFLPVLRSITEWTGQIWKGPTEYQCQCFNGWKYIIEQQSPKYKILCTFGTFRLEEIVGRYIHVLSSSAPLSLSPFPASAGSTVLASKKSFFPVHRSCLSADKGPGPPWGPPWMCECAHNCTIAWQNNSFTSDEVKFLKKRWLALCAFRWLFSFSVVLCNFTELYNIKAM